MTINDFYDLIDWAKAMTNEYKGRYRSEGNANDMAIEVYLKGTDRLIATFDIMEDVGFVISGVSK